MQRLMEMGFQRGICTYVFLVAFITWQLVFFAASDITGPHVGFCYRTFGDDLPQPQAVIGLITTYKPKIIDLRIYDPNPDILDALRESEEIFLLLGVENTDIPSLARSPQAATYWVNKHIFPYKHSVNIAYVVVGNEMIPGDYASYVAPAMVNMKNALNAVALSNVKVSTATAFNLQTSFPPSAGAFAPDVAQIMKDVTNVLRNFSTPLLVNIYPYYAHVSDPQHISFEYATFNATTPVIDGQLRYFSLLDAQIDAYHAALAQIGAEDVGIILGETGWPSAGNEPYTSKANAHTYVSNFYKRVVSGKGTPRLPNFALDGFLFSMFDENQMHEGVNQHWGLFYNDGSEKYPISR